MATINKTERKEILHVLDMYGVDLQNIKIVRDTVGFVNKIYFITTADKKLVLRKSNPVTTFAHIKLEAKLLDYLSAHDFAATPKIINNLKGTNITVYNKAFFTLQTFMPGSAKASWNDLRGFTTKRVDSFFATVAAFNKAVEKFPKINNLANQPLWHFVKNGEKLFAKLYKSLSSSAGKKIILKNYQTILNFIEQTRKEFLQTGFNSLPKQLVHFDFHPGNVNFLGSEVSALFDFDWARYDARFSDLASGIGQSCYYYGGQSGGQFRKDRIKQAIASYHRAYGKSNFDREEELKFIKVALRGYSIYIFFWAVDLYQKTPTRENFLVMKHFLKLILVNDFDWLFS